MNDPFEDEIRQQLRHHAAGLPVGAGDVEGLVARARRRQVARRVGIASVALAAVAVAAVALPQVLPARPPIQVPVGSNEAVAPTATASPSTAADPAVRGLLLSEGNLVVVADGVHVVEPDGTTTPVPNAEVSVGWAWADGRGGLVHQPAGDRVVRVIDGRVEQVAALDRYEPLVREASVLPDEQIVLEPQSLRLADVDPLANTMLIVVRFGSAEWFTDTREVTTTVRIDTGEVLASFEELVFEAGHSRSLAGELLSFASWVEVVESIGVTDLGGGTVRAAWADGWVDDNGADVVRDVEFVPGGDAVALVARDGTVRLLDRRTGESLDEVPRAGLGSLSDASTVTVVGQATHWAAGAHADDVVSLVVDLADGRVTSIDGRATLVHAADGN